MSRALAPLGAGLLGLVGALAATLFLYRSAAGALDRALDERLRGAGETAAALLASGAPVDATLRAVAAASALEGAYVVTPGLVLVADAADRGGDAGDLPARLARAGPGGRRAGLLRVDAARVERAARGEPSVAFAWAIADQPVASGYFPVRAGDQVVAVLALEAGQAFGAARTGLVRALLGGVALAIVAGLALAVAARAWARAEARAVEAAGRAARGDALVRMGAMVAHELRNPLGVIRGAAELVQARAGAGLAPRDREALGDVLGEVERLRRLSEDFLDLAREPALVPAAVDLGEVAEEAARAFGRAHPEVAVRVEPARLPARADPDRIRQVLANLLQNAAQAGAREVVLAGRAGARSVTLTVRDDGPGVDAAVRARLFDPFVSGRARGAGLGLAIARRIAERHGGALTLADGGPPGAAFELTLPGAE